MRLFALRGAISVERNDAADIHAATITLMREIMQRNDLRPRDVVSCIFTVTKDLNAEFPAAGTDPAPPGTAGSEEVEAVTRASA